MADRRNKKDSRKKRKRGSDIDPSDPSDDSNTSRLIDEADSSADFDHQEKAVVVDSKSLKVRVKRVNVDKKEDGNIIEGDDTQGEDMAIENSDTNDAPPEIKEPEENPLEQIALVAEQEQEARDAYYNSVRNSKMAKFARESAFYNIRLLMERHRVGPFYKDSNTNTVQVVHSYVIPSPIMEAVIPDPENPDLNIIDPDFITPNGYERPPLRPEDYDEEIGEPRPGVHRAIMDGYTQELKRELEVYRTMTSEKNFYDTWQEQFLGQWRLFQPSGMGQSYM